MEAATRPIELCVLGVSAAESTLWAGLWICLGAAVTAAVAYWRWRRNRVLVRADERRRSADRIAELRSMTGGLAHEIKNPLSTLVLNAQLLREDVMDLEVDEEMRRRVNRRVDALAREAARLRQILEDFLRFAGRIQLDRQPRDLREIVDELVDFFQPQAAQSGVLLRMTAPNEPVIASVDAGLLKQALLNLMINAVQAMEGTSRRELLVRIEHERHGPAQEVRIHVIDTGPGIPEAQQPNLFLPYTSSRPGGTGLGLATTRRIAEEHGGRVTLFTEVGVGTDFVLHLPLAQPRGPDEQDSGASSGASPPHTAGASPGGTH